MMSVTRSVLTGAFTLAAASASAGTFQPAPLLPEANVERLDLDFARQHLQRDLVGDPHASVVIGRVDVYGRFPYLEARYFQVVSDPGWNRLLFGENGRGLRAFDGADTPFGSLREPRGMAVDERGRLYVADSGNDRVLVFATSSEFDRLELVPVFAVEGLARPHDVAFSDGGTPFDPSDDRLYVADTGNNRVVRVDLTADGGRIGATIGSLGSGEGRFAGPTAITVSRTEGRNGERVYVGDSHARRVVMLRDADGSFAWEGALGHDLPEITGLDTDHWGNVYAASPRGGVVRKFAPDLLPVADLEAGVDHPRGFHVPMLTVHDHVRGTVTRAGHGSGVMVERWDERSGVRLLDLGVEITDVAVTGEDLHFTLTDRAQVRARVVDPRDGRVLREVMLGDRDAGRASASLVELGRGLAAGETRVELHAVSTYGADRTASASTLVHLDGDAAPQARVAAVLGATPNPFNPHTRIEFVVPSGRSLLASLEIVDARGRVVRRYGEASFGPGVHGFEWNGVDTIGRPVASGVYVFRLVLDGGVHTGKLALVK
jgi:hypothetical protein